MARLTHQQGEGAMAAATQMPGNRTFTIPHYSWLQYRAGAAAMAENVSDILYKALLLWQTHCNYLAYMKWV